MFRPTDKQGSLLECQFLLSPEKRQRLEKSWAQVFRTLILPLIDEEMFRDAFHEDNGRPNKSIELLVGLHLLKEWDDLTDEQVINGLEFNLQWHYALAVESADVHVCQKTLHNFRVKFMENDRAQEMFESLTRGLAEADGLELGRQRLDSTHVISNIAILTRLGLFVETVVFFLKALKRECPEKLEALESGYRRRYLEREGYFADAKRSQARRRLPVVAKDIHELLLTFAEDKVVRSLESYKLLERLFEEQCELTNSQESEVSANQPVFVPCVVVEPNEDEEGSAVTQTGEAKGKSSEGQSGTGTQPGSSEGQSSTGAQPGSSEGQSSTGAQPGSSEGQSSTGTQPESSIRLKDGKEISSASLQSPYDSDATYGHKGKGYEVQVSETCVEDNPYQLITGVSVNGAHESDQYATVAMAQQLQQSRMTPKELWADTAYGSGQNTVDCAEMGIDLQAPVQDPSAPKAADLWKNPASALVSDTRAETKTGIEVQSQPSGPLGLSAFLYTDTFDEVVDCPNGKTPYEQHLDKTKKRLWAIFSAEDCESCPYADRCPTKKKRSGDRFLRTTRAKAATAHQQSFQRTGIFKDRYKIRSGIESTNAELKGRHGARDLRIRGKKRVSLAMMLKCMALNAKRAAQYHIDSLLRDGEEAGCANAMA
jgi:hypothetical protein